MTSLPLSQHPVSKQLLGIVRPRVFLAPLAGTVLLAALSLGNGRPAMAQLPDTNTSFATALSLTFPGNTDPSIQFPNDGFANGYAGLGESRFFKFLVTSPGTVNFGFVGFSSAPDRGSIAVYDASQNLIAPSFGRYDLLDGFYYTAFTVTSIFDSSPNHVYSFEVSGAEEPGFVPTQASLAPAGAPPSVPESGSLPLLGLGLLPVGLLIYRRKGGNHSA